MMSELAVQTNDLMPNHAFNFLCKFLDESEIKNMNVALLGVSYLADVGDTRYSPVEPLYRFLRKLTSNIYLHDPYVNFWEELELVVNNTNDINNILGNEIDLLIFSTGHSLYKDNKKNLLIAYVAIDSCFIYDTIGILTDLEIERLASKHKVKVLGGGDI